MEDSAVTQTGAPPASAAGSEPPHDRAAVVTIVLVATLAIILSWLLPWWIMKARAPQYGQRILVIDVGPRDVNGDVREIDMLGHYVGIQPMGGLARFERALAPLGMTGAVFGILLAPWLRRRWMRLLFVLPAVLMPLILLVDLKFWMTKAVNDRNPEAALTLTTRINPKLFGDYDVGQFKVATELGGGFYVAAIGGLLGLGLVFAAPLRIPKRQAARQAVPHPELARHSATTSTVLLLAGAGLATGVAARAPADQVVVGGHHPTIAAALAAAHDGDTIIVPAGRYAEHLVIDKRVRLVGRANTVIDGSDEGTVLRITAPGVEVRGLTVRNSGTTYNTEDAGIRIDHAAGAHIVQTRIEGTLFGVFIANGDQCVIDASTIIGKDLPAVRRGDSIRLWYSSGCRLTGNQIDRSRDLVIWYSSNTVVEDNVVRHSRYGLHYMYSDNNVFHRNRFEDNQVGAAIMYSRGIDLTENAFSFSKGVAAYGLLLKDADDVFIVENRFIDNSTGLFFDGAPQAKDGRVDVRGNLIARGDIGVALQPLSRRIRFWDNAFVGNHTQVQVLGTGTAEGNEWSVNGHGNYWSDAVIYDRNHDGVSEIPYRSDNVYEVLADRYPQLGFFAMTPAAEAIDLAARLFPIFAPRPKLVDAHPLVEPPLTAWTRTADASGGAGFAAAGGGLLSIAALGVIGARTLLS
jgi:nitrous oxidase accessory protein